MTRPSRIPWAWRNCWHVTVRCAACAASIEGSLYMKHVPIDLLGKQPGDRIGPRLWQLRPCSLCGSATFLLVTSMPEMTFQQEEARETEGTRETPFDFPAA